MFNKNMNFGPPYKNFQISSRDIGDGFVYGFPKELQTTPLCVEYSLIFNILNIVLIAMALKCQAGLLTPQSRDFMNAIHGHLSR